MPYVFGQHLEAIFSLPDAHPNDSVAKLLLEHRQEHRRRSLLCIGAAKMIMRMYARGQRDPTDGWALVGSVSIRRL
jgi:hypothetical protein